VIAKLFHRFPWLGRLHLRLLIVNVLVVLVPIAGIGFARLFERELLRSLERDMRNQAVLVRRFIEASPDPFDRVHEASLRNAARDTRTRIRILGPDGGLQLDSHREGAPEGAESTVPSYAMPSAPMRRTDAWAQPWPNLEDRNEVRTALSGERSSYTRVRERGPSVLLFVAEPVFAQRRVLGVVYVTRSTTPVMAELHRIRVGLQKVLILALVFTAAITLWLAHSITTPLRRLSMVASRIAKGEVNLDIPVSGVGELRALAEALKTMTERQRERMQAIATFAADVAHAFKSPLTSIRGASELLTQGAVDDPAVRQRFLRNIELDSERLDRLVTRLLQLSRIEASTESWGSVDLADLLAEVAERSSTPDVSVIVEHHAQRMTVQGRRADLGTAFANLMDNAVKASPSDMDVTVRLDTQGGRAIVQILDGGPGVPQELRPRLFERFFTTDNDGGTGLGLAIAQSVVKAHGGLVRLDPDSPARGACFRVELPCEVKPG